MFMAFFLRFQAEKEFNFKTIFSKILKFGESINWFVIYIFSSFVSCSEKIHVRSILWFAINNLHCFHTSEKNQNSKFLLGEFNDHVCKAHLARIPDYILPGHNVWWKKDGNVIEFMDGDYEVNNRPEGSKMMNFKSCNITEVRKIKYRNNKTCLLGRIHLYNS